MKILPIEERKKIKVGLEPELIKLLEEKLIEDKKEMFKTNPDQFNLLSWDRSAYIRRLIINSLDIKLEK